MEWSVVAALGTMAFAVLGAEWTLAVWLQRQFSLVKALVYERTELIESRIVAKLEYHERHDDQRFSAISSDLVAIRIRNAARDRKLEEERK